MWTGIPGRKENVLIEQKSVLFFGGTYFMKLSIQPITGHLQHFLQINSVLVVFLQVKISY